MHLAGGTPRLENLTSLKVLDANITSLGSIPSLTHLTVTGLSSVVDVGGLHDACPNLASLTLVGAKLVQSDQGARRTWSRHPPRRDLQLTSLSLRDTLGTAWRDLVRCSPHLAWLSLFNVVISDADVEAIIASNSLCELEGLRYVTLIKRRGIFNASTVKSLLHVQNRLRRDWIHPAHRGVSVAPRITVPIAQIIRFRLRLDGDRLTTALAYSFDKRRLENGALGRLTKLFKLSVYSC